MSQSSTGKKIAAHPFGTKNNADNIRFLSPGAVNFINTLDGHPYVKLAILASTLTTFLAIPVAVVDTVITRVGDWYEFSGGMIDLRPAPFKEAIDRREQEQMRQLEDDILNKIDAQYVVIRRSSIPEDGGLLKPDGSLTIQTRFNQEIQERSLNKGHDEKADVEPAAYLDYAAIKNSAKPSKSI